MNMHCQEQEIDIAEDYTIREPIILVLMTLKSPVLIKTEKF